MTMMFFIVVGRTNICDAWSQLSVQHRTFTRHSTTALFGYKSKSLYTRATGGGGGTDRSKRQERVGHLVQTELSKIVHSGLIKGRDVEFLEDELRQRISVVSSNVSPDLRQARISVSIRAAAAGSSGESSPAVDRRRAFSWLVRNTKALRHTLAQRMSHMKTCPEITFHQVDVSAAVDVMYLIDKVSAGAKRENVFDEKDLSGIIEGMDFDDDFDDDEDWDEDDEEFF
jgi:ribosome-binding factor A